jgi:hypothetical protein
MAIINGRRIEPSSIPNSGVYGRELVEHAQAGTGRSPILECGGKVQQIDAKRLYQKHELIDKHGRGAKVTSMPDRSKGHHFGGPRPDQRIITEQVVALAGQVNDMSGEVILARYGDGLCLNCLGRIAPTQIAAETVQGLGSELTQRGYVSGQDVKGPAVKTLNALLGAMAADALINQFTSRQPSVPVLVYESNVAPCIYPDTQSLENRPRECFHCG